MAQPASDNHQSLGTRVTRFLRVLGYQRFPIAMVVALFAISQVPQIREFLLIYQLPSGPALWEALFVGFSALAAWYAGRLTYRVDLRPPAQGAQSVLVLHPNLRRRLPRAYAILVPLAPAIASFQLGLYDKAIVYLLMAIGLGVAVFARRPLARRLMSKRMSLKADAADDTIVYRWRDLGNAERFWIITALIVAALLWTGSAWQPNWAAGAFGTTGVLFLSGGIVAVLGTVLMQLLVRAQWPFTFALLLWLGIVAVIPTGKLHRIDSATPSAPTPDESAQARMPDPFRISGPVLIAAEGGGIRAAYWSALALHTLDLLSRGELRRRTTLASGVSGGSLGLGTFALTGDAPSLQGTCTAPLEIVADSAPARALLLGHCFLAEDFLGPVMLRMLWFDSMRLFVPIPLWTDRGEALEDGWSRQWQRLSGRLDFDGPLSALSRGRTTWVLNSTHVQTGQRIIQSAPWIPDLPNLAPAALDGRAAVGLEIQLKQAVHNSARFSYVSPAGAVVHDDAVLQLVDGGYFENSGLSIVNDWLIYDRRPGARRGASEATANPFAVQASKQRLATTHRVEGISERAQAAQPLVLLLTNDPAVAPASPETCPRTSEHSRPKAQHELLAPIASLLQVRSARGTYARDQTRRLVGDANFFQLAIQESEISVPLGWALSRASIEEMQRQLWCEREQCGHSNPEGILEIVERLGVTRETAAPLLRQLCSAASASDATSEADVPR